MNAPSLKLRAKRWPSVWLTCLKSGANNSKVLSIRPIWQIGDGCSQILHNPSTQACNAARASCSNNVERSSSAKNTAMVQSGSSGQKKQTQTNNKDRISLQGLGNFRVCAMNWRKYAEFGCTEGTRGQQLGNITLPRIDFDISTRVYVRRLALGF